ncbi:MAG: N-acetylmuramoyl-L-alanine amidase [Ardenticatenales bacterium]|nr:N-acetylmuramoyl-L-alanine amidase [Ardenticatenales bacterium]
MATPPLLFDEYLAPAPPAAEDAPAPVSASSILPPAPPRTADGPAHRSPHTGYVMREPFLAFWTNFGAALCGEPLTDEVLIDGRRAQVFERLVLAEVAPGRVAPLNIGAQWLQAAADSAAGQPQWVGETLVIGDRTAELAQGEPTAAYPRRTLSEIRYVVVHHTGAAAGVGPEDIAREHRDALGWPGIGYHFVVDADGGVHQTQDLTVVSHHARQFNGVSVGVALCGNFDDTPPPPGQLDRAAALIAHLVDRLGLPLDAVRGHGELVPTPCPGRTYLGGWQPMLLDAVARYAGRAARHAAVRTVVPPAVLPTAAAEP